MEFFNPSGATTAAFVGLTLALAALNVWFFARSQDPEQRRRAMLKGGAVAIAWLGLHAGLSGAGLLAKDTTPPPAMPYLGLTMATAFVVAFSGVGRRLTTLPLAALVGLQAFRLPLEILLHQMFSNGNLPVQMTWTGYNYDVITGIGAAVLGVWLWKGQAPRAAIWIWNIVGLALLLNVITIALLSAPLPFRQFTNDPPVVLVFFPPFNWIVNVHVWTAMVGHLVIFRALKKAHVPA